MGLLTVGKPLTWTETKQYAEHVRQHGINQFINLYHNHKNRQDNLFKWGDEIEYMIVKFDHNNQKVRLSLKSNVILDIMDKREAEEGVNRAVLWRPEWGAYMLEATPGQPFGDRGTGRKYSFLNYLDEVEDNMRIRRQEMKALLNDNETIICLTSFPRLGTLDSTIPISKPVPSTSLLGSQFVNDNVACTYHPRYITVAKNGRSRRGRKIIINNPIFKDINTPDLFIEKFNDAESDLAAKIDHIYLDAQVFAMGNACLQVTFLGKNINEARLLYDQMAPVCAVMLALIAASPIQRGYLSDKDCRWSIMTAGLDDRTKEELGETPLINDAYRIQKSRYDTIDMYLCESSAKFNDIPITYDKRYYDQMVESGVERILAKHISHLFIRDPCVVYREKLEQNDELETDHFENIQSTNWQNMRFKPPPSQKSPIGWRVEFRPMELQMTDFENAAYSIFIILLTRVILTYKLDLLIPISKMDENMIEAQKRDAVNRCRFWFRKHVFTADSLTEVTDQCMTAIVSDDSCLLMTVNEIMNGYDERFPGLVPLLKHYLTRNCAELEDRIRDKINGYLDLISLRASGKLWTIAKWIRDFVRQHPDYKQDSVVNESINYDLLLTMSKFQSGDLHIDKLVGFMPDKNNNY